MSAKKPNSNGRSAKHAPIVDEKDSLNGQQRPSLRVLNHRLVEATKRSYNKDPAVCCNYMDGSIDDDFFIEVDLFDLYKSKHGCGTGFSITVSAFADFFFVSIR